MRELDDITNSMNMSLSKLWEIVKNRKAWHVTVHGSQKVKHDFSSVQSLSHVPLFATP